MEVKGGAEMKGMAEKVVKGLTVIAMLLSLVLVGCAPTQTGQATRDYSDNWRFVPRIHVEDDSFGTAGDYYQCSYDIKYEGYWCLNDE
jgi:hypothetical protein